MKITVERGAFLKALSHVQSVVERRNTIPILSNVMIEAAKGKLSSQRPIWTSRSSKTFPRM
jgi:DNA polymerase-3 subunit beta